MTGNMKLDEHIVGPMPTNVFFEDLMSPIGLGHEGLPKLKRVSKKVFQEFGKLAIDPVYHPYKAYAQFAQTVNDNRFCPNFILRHDAVQIAHSTEIRPNVCLFAKDSSESLHASSWASLEFIVSIDVYSADPFRFTFKSSQYNLRCEDLQYKHESKAGQERLSDYFSAQFARQHRIFTFAICISGHHVRFLRVDRSGIIVSDVTNYVKNPRILAEFFWRYNYLSSAERGFDPYTVPASMGERRLLNQAVLEYLERSKKGEVRRFPNLGVTLDKEFPAYKIRVVDEYEGDVHEFVVRRHFAGGSDLFGRATRGYVALRLRNQEDKDDEKSQGDKGGANDDKKDGEKQVKNDEQDDEKEGAIEDEKADEKEVEKELEMDNGEGEGDDKDEGMENEKSDQNGHSKDGKTNNGKDDKEGSNAAARDFLSNRLVFLKDAWRTADSDLEKESDIYNDLKEHSVSFIPSVICAGDVFCNGKPQRTTTGMFSVTIPSIKGAKISRKSMRKYVHHRVVQNLAFPLSTVRNARELIQVVRDALQSLIEAYKRGKRLHRDVSQGNVMISDAQGLSDARGILNDWDVSLNLRKFVSRKSVGTWYYMSSELLIHPEKNNDIFDDLESMFWVLVYTAAQYFKHMGWFPMHIFRERLEQQGRDNTGGSGKRDFLIEGRTRAKFCCPGLQDTIESLLNVWRQYHQREGDAYTLLKEDPEVLLIFFDKALEEEEADELWRDGQRVPVRYQYPSCAVGDDSTSRISISVGRTEEEPGQMKALEGVIQRDECLVSDVPVPTGCTKQQGQKRSAEDSEDGGAQKRPRRSARVENKYKLQK
ncbi:hypothetical protein K474DRAFT_1618198 [Panus rudis PR-1116 ss-1]|nr:hypothetical protein K474DRAFT_1618198 [Panus rudis PR-1116 ss-1]